MKLYIVKTKGSKNKIDFKATISEGLLTYINETRSNGQNDIVGVILFFNKKKAVGYAKKIYAGYPANTWKEYLEILEVKI